MVQAWRIVKRKHAATAFSGEGARQCGGRWNSRGVAVIYTSGSCALAALETLVHLNPQMLFHYVVFRLEWDARLGEAWPAAKLPANWRSEPPPVSAQVIGDAWAKQQRSAVLALPSVIIPSETNFLLNPAHADFAKIKISPPEDFAFDSRLVPR